MEEVEDTDTGKGLCVDVCEDGRSRGSVHRTKLGEDEVKLAEGVDDNEQVGDLELLCIPKKGPGANADIAQNVVRHITKNLGTLLGTVGVELPNTIEPSKLDDLLRREKPSDEVGLRTPERGVCVINLFHRGCTVECILLNSKIVGEGGRCKPFSGALFDAHSHKMVSLSKSRGGDAGREEEIDG